MTEINKTRKNTRKYLKHGPTKIRLKDQSYAESLQEIIRQNYQSNIGKINAAQRVNAVYDLAMGGNMEDDFQTTEVVQEKKKIKKALLSTQFLYRK